MSDHLDKDEEKAISELLEQSKTEFDPELAVELANMLERLRDGASLFVLPGPAILKQIAMIFDLGRRYEATLRSDQYADHGS